MGYDGSDESSRCGKRGDNSFKLRNNNNWYMNWLRYRATIYLVAVSAAIALRVDTSTILLLGIVFVLGSIAEYYRG